MTYRRAIVAVLVLSAIGTGAWYLSRDYQFDLDTVAIAGELVSQQRAELSAVLLEHKDEIEGLPDVKHLIDGVSWVHHVDVVRRWPDKLTLTVHPERAIAYWNDDAFINDEGRVFSSEYLQAGSVAQLYGPEGGQQSVMRQYLELNKALTRAGQDIEILTLDDRGSWHFTTSEGIRVMLGKDDIMERIQRFLLVVESVGLTERMNDIEQIDTRYPNGMAVSWAQSLDVAKTENTQREPRL